MSVEQSQALITIGVATLIILRWSPARRVAVAALWWIADIQTAIEKWEARNTKRPP